MKEGEVGGRNERFKLYTNLFIVFENALEKSIRLREDEAKIKRKMGVCDFRRVTILQHFPTREIHAMFCNENWFYYIKVPHCSMMLIVFAKSSYYLLLLKFTFMRKTRKVSRQKRVFFSSIIKRSNLIKFENWVEWKRFQVCSMTFKPFEKIIFFRWKLSLSISTEWN